MNKYLKYSLIAIATIGVGFGVYKLYQYYNKEDGMKTKFGKTIRSVNTNVDGLN
jgi:hypothetical protein